MLCASRRSFLASSRQAVPLLSSDSLATFVVGCSKDLERDWRQFSTSSPFHNAPRTRLTKEKVAAKLDKLERKRSERAVKAMAAGVRTAEARVTTLEKGLELEEKRIASEELAEGLEPFTEEQLEGFYQGLLGATPEELALPALEGSSDLLLVDLNADVESREERLRALEDRLDSLGGGEVLPIKAGNGGGLSERLLSRRAGKLPATTVEVRTPDSTELSATRTPTRRILDTLESLLPFAGATAAGEAGSEEPTPVTVGIAVQSEFRDLILSSAEDGDIEGVKTGLNLLRRSIPSAETTLLTEVMALYGSQGRTRDALELAKFARENSLPMSVTTHHYLLSSLLPLHPTLAIQHLHSLEAVGHTPLLESYTLVIRTLLAPTSPPHLVSRAWDLYAHTRLVSHPTPDVALFATMIRACSRGPFPSPERAIDLFTEMTSENGLPPSQEAYNGVIRACAREGTQAYYFEALRFMRQMLDANVAPTRHTFHAILEGAKRHGDLARARWMLVKMIGVGGDAAPDANSLGLVFQTYAAYKLPSPQGTRRMKTQASNAPSAAVAAPSSTSLVYEAPSAPSSSYSVEASKTDAIVDLLGESSLFYPGPLPQTPDELLAEAKNLMTQCVGLDALSPPPSDSPIDTTSPPFISSIFSSVVPSTFLLNSYLNVLSSHGPFDDPIAFFNSAYTRLRVPKNRFSFERMMTRCETAKNRQLAERVARDVFGEWKAWEAQESEVEKEVVEESVAEDKTDEESLRSGDKGHKSGRNISIMWASMIRILSRNYSDTEALSLLQSFIATYPPLNLVWSAHSARAASRALPTQPSPMRLSTIAYPETTSSAPLNRPPFILFDDVRLLHLRLASVEDRKGTATVKAICKAYEGALRTAKEYEQGKAQKKKEVKGEERKK